MLIVKVLFFRVENGGVVHFSPDVLHNVTPNSVPSTDVYPDSTHSSLDGIYSILCFYSLQFTVTCYTVAFVPFHWQ